MRPPFSAEVAAQEAGLLLVPWSGPLAVDGVIVRYDPERPDAEGELWAVTCGHLLRRVGAPDTVSQRAQLARELGGGSGVYRAVTACSANVPLSP